MLISIVTPSFNQAAFLEETIQSVLSQDYAPIEYIVVDGGSTDGSVDIIRKYADRLAWWVSEKDKGHADALNKGFSHAHGEVMAFINSDDTLASGAVSEAMAYLQAHPEVGFVYGEADYINARGQVVGHFPAAQTDYRRMLQGYVHIPQQASFWRRDLWEKVGPLSTSLYFAFDYDMWVKMAKISPLVYLPGRRWAYFRLHGGAKTDFADSRCWPDMLQVHYREGGSFFSLMVARYYLRKLAAPYLRWKRRRLYSE